MQGIKSIDTGTIVRAVVLFVALINQGLASFRYSSMPFNNEQVEFAFLKQQLSFIQIFSYDQWQLAVHIWLICPSVFALGLSSARLYIHHSKRNYFQKKGRSFRWLLTPLILSSCYRDKKAHILYAAVEET
ncbi:phage holin [Domibacillus mangrovi]|uniref:Uncharacterized protein n=1 Tax=Domibacillus mangrovi TaxID=1714354 RepID=A0A1Q5P456_9BACI|nr:phage holin [Domibacillus mangrovi]OKL36921.1 hypothetical protein BLL40_09415 [Domibacillus mangrovi]